MMIGLDWADKYRVKNVDRVFVDVDGRGKTVPEIKRVILGCVSEKGWV